MSPPTASQQPTPQPAIIGIVGGVGPLAGLDLQAKIVAQTVAGRDQEHLPVLSLSWPGPIADRTKYLLGQVAENPAHAIVAQLRLLAAMGATVAAIPCNTAHAPAIFDVIRDGVARFTSPLRLLHMLDETADHLATHLPGLRTVGVLSTTGTWRARLYPQLLEQRGLRVVAPDAARQETIHAAIYDPAHGIKSAGRVTARARADLARGVVARFTSPLRLLHMLDETADYLAAHLPGLRTVGILSTTGTWRARLYPQLLERRGLRVVAPDAARQETIHAAIYDPAHGIKSAGRVTARARADLARGVVALRAQGAEAVVLGCTELPLAFAAGAYDGLPLIDPTWVLARALIREAAPGQLRALQV